jgi:tetratricopeptide (TPR) repeat protein
MMNTSESAPITGDLSVAVQLANGVTLIQQGHHQEAIEQLTAAIEQLLAAIRQLNVVYAERGKAHAKLGQFKQAIDDFTSALAQDRDDSQLLFDRGLAFLNDGRLDAAMGDFTRSIELNPNFARAHAERGAIYRRQGRHRQAMDDYLAALRLDPSYAVQYVCQSGLFHAARGDYQNAIGAFTVALAMDPTNASARRAAKQVKEAWEKQKQRAAAFAVAVKMPPPVPPAVQLSKPVESVIEPPIPETKVEQAEATNATVVLAAKTSVAQAALSPTLIEEEASQILLQGNPEEDKHLDEKEPQKKKDNEKPKELADRLPSRLRIQRAIAEAAGESALDKPKPAADKPKPGRRRPPIRHDDEPSSGLQRWKLPAVAGVAIALLAYFFFATTLLKARDRLPLQPVHGQAFFLNQPLANASIVLDPAWTKEPNFPRPHAVVGDDGSFTLSTYGRDDGAPDGEYRVMVTWFVRAAGQDYDGAPAPRNKLPPKYGKFETSGLGLRIEKGQSEIPPLQLR